MADQQKKLIIGLLGYLAQRECSPDDLCRLANISMSQLRNDEQPLTEKQIKDVWINAVHISKDDLFGLHFGESLQLSALGIVGELIKTSDNVGSALTIAASFTPLITTAFVLAIEQQNETFSIEFKSEITDWQQISSITQVLDFLMVFVIHELDGLVMRKLHPLEVSIARPIKYKSEYDRVMRCKTIADATSNRITFDKAYWNLEIITANYDMQQFLLQISSKALQMNENSKTLKSRIYDYMIANSYLGVPSLDDVASNFNSSARTLQRKLKDGGISFQQLADEVKKSIATDYLQTGDYSVKEISYMLGYNELSAFTRSFKRWTGYPPTSFQRITSN